MFPSTNPVAVSQYQELLEQFDYFEFPNRTYQISFQVLSSTILFHPLLLTVSRFPSFVETNPSLDLKYNNSAGPELVVVIPDVGCPPNAAPDGESFTTSGFNCSIN